MISAHGSQPASELPVVPAQQGQVTDLLGKVSKWLANHGWGWRKLVILCHPSLQLVACTVQHKALHQPSPLQAASNWVLWAVRWYHLILVPETPWPLLVRFPCRVSDVDAMHDHELCWDLPVVGLA